MRIALLSNVTADLLKGMLEERGHGVWLPEGWNAPVQTALSPPAALREFDPQLVAFLVDGTHAQVDEKDVAAAVAGARGEFPRARVERVDLRALAEECGDGFFDERMWTLAAMPWSLKGLGKIADEMDRLAGATPLKAVAVDMDGVLWEGVVGEDGVDGVKPRTGFQRELLALRRRGVVLVALSRNNAADVKDVWGVEGMALAEDDFSAMRVDWGDKAENLLDVARELNLGADSFLFIDDNPAEREAMRAKLPQTVTPDFPEGGKDAERWMRRLARAWFPEGAGTEEDRLRTQSYRAERERKASAAGLTLEGYLDGLEMWLDVHRAREDELERVAQLSARTNQFNLTTHRRTTEEFRRIVREPGWLLMTARSGDRFGTLGLVSYVLAKVKGKEATIEDWAMSCRAMNRTIEFAVAERVEAELAAMGVETVCGTYVPTAKNAPVAGFFDALGYECDGEDGGVRRYRLALPADAARRRHARMAAPSA